MVESAELLVIASAGGLSLPLGPSAVYQADLPRASVARSTRARGGDRSRTRSEIARAWHGRRQPEADEAVAELEHLARAQARGGFAAAAAFLELATALTPEESRRSGRALAAARQG